MVIMAQLDTRNDVKPSAYNNNDEPQKQQQQPQQPQADQPQQHELPPPSSTIDKIQIKRKNVPGSNNIGRRNADTTIKRLVTFCSEVPQIYAVTRLMDMTESEKYAIWYDKHDYKNFKKNSQKCMEQLLLSRPKSSSSSSSSTMSRGMKEQYYLALDQPSTVSSNKNSQQRHHHHNNFFDEEDDCLRGVERTTPAKTREYNDRRHKLMRELIRLRDEEIQYEPEDLAQLFQAFTASSAREALVVACKDQCDAIKCYQHSWKKEGNESKDNMNDSSSSSLNSSHASFASIREDEEGHRESQRNSTWNARKHRTTRDEGRQSLRPSRSPSRRMPTNSSSSSLSKKSSEPHRGRLSRATSMQTLRRQPKGTSSSLSSSTARWTPERYSSADSVVLMLQAAGLPQRVNSIDSLPTMLASKPRRRGGVGGSGMSSSSSSRRRSTATLSSTTGNAMPLSSSASYSSLSNKNTSPTTNMKDRTRTAPGRSRSAAEYQKQSKRSPGVYKRQMSADSLSTKQHRRRHREIHSPPISPSQSPVSSSPPMKKKSVPCDPSSPSKTVSPKEKQRGVGGPGLLRRTHSSMMMSTEKRSLIKSAKTTNPMTSTNTPKTFSADSLPAVLRGARRKKKQEQQQPVENQQPDHNPSPFGLSVPFPSASSLSALRRKKSTSDLHEVNDTNNGNTGIMDASLMAVKNRRKQRLATKRILREETVGRMMKTMGIKAAVAGTGRSNNGQT